jgi:hypothetical protein
VGQFRLVGGLALLGGRRLGPIQTDLPPQNFLTRRHKNKYSKTFEASDIEYDAHLAVLSTPPTTIAGIAAVLRYAAREKFGPGEPTVLGHAMDTEDSDLHAAAAGFLSMIAESLLRMNVQS